MTRVSGKQMANAIRFLSMDAVQRANSGHPGMPLGMADVATVLFSSFLKFDPKNPHWPDRDRFVLSAGHGSMLLYSLLHLCGYKDFPVSELENFRQWGSRTAGHPEYGHGAGIETTTGPLGQGLSTAVGMAMAERMLNSRFGDELVNHRTYVIAGDGCLMEGISHEAISLAGHLKLSKLIVLFDDNQITIDGDTDISCSDDQLARFIASGWRAERIDGHDEEAVKAALERAQDTDKPSFIACKTVIGYGAPNKQGSHDVHGAPLGDDEIKAARSHLGWEHPPFEIPQPIRDAWLEVGAQGGPKYEDWEKRLRESEHKIGFEQQYSAFNKTKLDKAIEELKATFSNEKPKLASRQSSQKVIEKLVDVVPALVGGSADLSGSNGTKVKAHRPMCSPSYDGNYIHYGVREHGMAAAMNGLALHGGLIPYGGTFLVFSDYCRGAMRLSALMGVKVIYIMTHDSIGLGEDGPTHQPVEHVPSLRLIPNLLVFRPADAVEMAEAWACALNANGQPSVLCLTRQGLPTLRSYHTKSNLVGKGAYVLKESEGTRQITLMASGSEVHLAIEAATRLAEKDIHAAVVSVPCMELFDCQDEKYKKGVLGTAPRVAIEAALEGQWRRYLAPQDVFIGMQGFGASAPAERLFSEFGITVNHLVEAALKRLD